jgi:PEP-CTERM motif
MNTFLKNHAAKLLAGLALLAAPALKAQLTFHVDINTSALSSALNAPFFLDFQLNQGSGSLNNSVTLSNFSFTSGGATGTASLFGNATGSLTSTVSLTDTTVSPFNEFFQGFSTSTTSIHFDAVVSQHVPGVTPDGFLVAILDSEAGFPQIATSSPDGVSLVALGIGSANTLADVHTYSSISPRGVTALVSAVPEPSTYAAAGGAMLLGLIALRRRKAARS